MATQNSVSELIKLAAGELAAAGIADPRREASSLLSFAISRDRTFIIAHPEFEVPAGDLLRFRSILSRRAKREPLRYITGKQEFYGLEFDVEPGVLIPRPETEILVESAVGFLANISKPRFCEVGLGSGCISAAILANAPEATGVGLEISEAAIAIAARNVSNLGIASRLEIRRSNVFSALARDERFDALVSNPPYVPLADIAGLQPEVRDHEPLTALSDGGDGLSIVREIIDGAPGHLNPRGLLLVEIGFSQSKEVSAMVDPNTWDEPVFIDDLQGIPRILSVRLRP